MDRHRDLIYDRSLRHLTAPGILARVHAHALQLSHKALAPVGYFGVSKVFGLVNRLFPTGGDAVVTEGEFRFRFPADDYYWNRLLDAEYEYEPEIDRLLRGVSHLDFVFVDLGANFGYWSTRVAAALYGRRRLIAVEASATCCEVLRRNLQEYGLSDSAYHYAVADRSGLEVQLFGERHAGFSIDSTWAGASSAVAGTVLTISLDDLLREAGIDASVTPLVVKLDVEGVERQVLEGAPIAAAGPSLFLVEDATGPGRVSDAVRHAHEHLGMRLYVMDGLPLRRLEDLDKLLMIKRRQSRIQQRGLNLVASASPSWWDVLEVLEHGSEVSL
jgi:FkbM family methyltransferase